jgi:hypothetical protein
MNWMHPFQIGPGAGLQWIAVSVSQPAAARRHVRATLPRHRHPLRHLSLPQDQDKDLQARQSQYIKLYVIRNSRDREFGREKF